MVKKLNTNTIIIKDFLKKGYKQFQISFFLEIKKEKLAIGFQYDLRMLQEKSKRLKEYTFKKFKDGLIIKH